MSASSSTASPSTRTQQLLDAMQFRCIGPSRGGRVIAVAGDPSKLATFYFGAVAGGVWKTEDAGAAWQNVSDGFFKTASVGALTVSASDPNVIYAGMGESTIRTDVSHGDGVYKSTDGGKTWRHLGLEQTRHIGEIRIHPKNPDHVYVAALGHAFGPNDERGLYRSTDGGANWQKILFKSAKAGVVDVSFDPHNPQVIYASVWETHRNFWELSSGGADSGLWKSTDGGDTWSDISRAKGLPQSGIYGKIGVSASPAQAGRVWALMEASEKPGLYRSDDFGDTWTLLTDSQDLRYRPWYYMHVFADPQDADTVYVNNLGFWKSTDGGKTFTGIATPHGDNHDLWIDPANNQRMIQSNDGGANISYNGGRSWSSIYNQLTAQFYTVTTDNQQPHYRVYGTQQDNSSISVPSNTNDGAIVWSDCYPAGTGESGYMAVHPENSNIVYVGAVGSSPGGGGALQRYDHATGQIQLVNVWPQAHGGMGAGELKYRFPWTFPILFSPHDANTLYTAGNVVFRSRDEGHSWQPISPDLTRNALDKLGASGGPITKDTSGAEHYCTIYTLRESPHEAGVFWAGSDDGLVHISRDGGASWQNVTPPDLPEWSYIRTVEPSPFDPATLYLAATRYKLDDPAPYLYKTTDYGATWTAITGAGDGAIPADIITRVIRADLQQPGLLYTGTETGLYLSFDDGGSWQRWQSNLPVAPIYDLTIKNNDLVIGTHGRSFWIVDDLTPLHQLAQAGDGAHLFTPRATWRLLPDLFGAWTGSDGKDYAIGLAKAATFVATKDETGQVVRDFLDAGRGAPNGAIVYYVLDAEPAADANISLRFVDANGALIREFTPKPANYDDLDDKEKELQPGPWITAKAGVNRFVWDLRHPGAERLAGNKTAGEAHRGPLVLPGAYQVELKLGEQTLRAQFDVVNDPRSPIAQADLETQLKLLLQIRDKISELNQQVARLRKVNTQVAVWGQRLSADGKDELAAAAKALAAKLDAIESALIIPGEHKDTFGLNQRVRLNAALSSVISVVGSADAKPTQQARELAEEYMAQIDSQLEQLDDVLSEELMQLNNGIYAAGVAAIGG
ncbi:MAG: glycosyl hydrolase [Caldilineaceae bacterium]